MGLEITPRLKVFRDKLWSAGELAGIEVYHTVGNGYAYVLTQVFNQVCIPHIYVKPKYRNKDYLSYITDVFHSEYLPELKFHGCTTVVTTCDYKDIGTIRFLELLGFTNKIINHASMDLTSEVV